MTVTLEQLGNSMLSSIYGILTGGDDKVPPSPHSFVSWCTPGLPFTAEDFTFCAKGLGSSTTAEEEKLLLNQAYAFSTLVDFIPEREGYYNNDQQQNIWRTSQARLSSMYLEILKAAKVVNQELTQVEQAKLQMYRNLLRTRKTVKNVVTDEKQEVVVDAPMLQAYNDMAALYDQARLLYSAKRIAALSASGPEGKIAVVDWETNGDLYYKQVLRALSNWQTGGYKEDVEAINAYIQNVTQRNMDVWKKNLQDDYESAQVTALDPGRDFFTQH